MCRESFSLGVKKSHGTGLDLPAKSPASLSGEGARVQLQSAGQWYRVLFGLLPELFLMGCTC